IQAQSRLAADHSAVRVQVPLLIGPRIAVPDLHARAGAGRVARNVEAFAAVDLQLAVGQVGPLLVAAAVAVPDVQQGAVRRGLAGNIQAPVRPGTAQHAAGAATASAAAAGVAADSPAPLQPVEPRLVVQRERETRTAALQRRDRAGGVLAWAGPAGLGR